MGKRSWIIDVCRYCGHLAMWPGCEHWQSSERWTVPVRVTGSFTPAITRAEGTYDPGPKPGT